MCAASRFGTVGAEEGISITNGYPLEDETGSGMKGWFMKGVVKSSARACVATFLLMASASSFAGCPSLEGQWRSTGALPDGRAYACNVVVDKGGVLVPPSNCILYDDLGNRGGALSAQGVWSVEEGEGICRISSDQLVLLTTITGIDGRVNRKGDVISEVSVLGGALSGIVTPTWHRMSNK